MATASEAGRAAVRQLNGRVMALQVVRGALSWVECDVAPHACMNGVESDGFSRGLIKLTRLWDCTLTWIKADQIYASPITGSGVLWAQAQMSRTSTLSGAKPCR